MMAIARSTTIAIIMVLALACAQPLQYERATSSRIIGESASEMSHALALMKEDIKNDIYQASLDKNLEQARYVGDSESWGEYITGVNWGVHNIQIVSEYLLSSAALPA